MAKTVGTTKAAQITEVIDEHFETSEEFVKRQLAGIVEERKKKAQQIEKELLTKNHILRILREAEAPLLQTQYEELVKQAKINNEKLNEDIKRKQEALKQRREDSKDRMRKVEADFAKMKEGIDEEKKRNISQKEDRKRRKSRSLEN